MAGSPQTGRGWRARVMPDTLPTQWSREYLGSGLHVMVPCPFRSTGTIRGARGRLQALCAHDGSALEPSAPSNHQETRG